MQIARVTMPSVPITSPAFVYRNRDCTDVSQTWERHRQSLVKQEEVRQASKPRKRPAAMTVRRVRAGTVHATLPLFEEPSTC